jgi:hypothetical protein
MVEAKNKNVELVVAPCKKLPDIAVICGVFYKVDKHCLKQLKNGAPCEEEKAPAGVESAALAFALFEVVRDKFIGSPLEMSRSRVSRIECHSLNGKFLITYNTQGSVSMLRKTMGLILGALQPSKLYSRYAENMKLLGTKSDRACFNHEANQLCAAIKKHVKFVAVGKIKVDGAKLKDILSKVVGKQPKLDLAPAKLVSKPPKREEYKQEYPVVKTSGIAAIVSADYIRSKSVGMNVCVWDSGVVVYNHSWESKHKALKKADRIKDYVRQKYEKLGENFACVLAYLAITQKWADCCTVHQLVKSNPKPGAMVELLKKAL